MFRQTPRKTPSSSPSVARTPVSPVASEAEREQALRDYKVTIEYKHLKSHAPGGVYLVPSVDNLRLFYGVIFVRRGPFTNGIFKFRLQLPTAYNNVNKYPEIFFTSPVYNPYVDPETGQLDLKTSYPNWDPSHHYLVTVLTFVKKIFYSKTFEEAMANPEAKHLAGTNPPAFRAKVDLCVRASVEAVFQNTTTNSTNTADHPASPSTATDSNKTDDASFLTLKFTEETVHHRVVRELLRTSVKDPSQVSKAMILSMIEQASKAYTTTTTTS